MTQGTLEQHVNTQADTTTTTPSLYLRSRVIRMNAVATGIVLGIVAGLGLFVATNVLVLKGGDVVGPHLALLGQVYVGYTVTFVGSLIGFAYAAATGFVVGYAGSKLYNLVAHWGQR